MSNNLWKTTLLKSLRANTIVYISVEERVPLKFINHNSTYNIKHYNSTHIEAKYQDSH